jgi:iron complex transport system ATP-binding protein
MKLEIRDLSYSVGKLPLLQHIHFEAQGGELTGIIGPNGAGKSTLLKHIAGIVPCQKKSVFLDGVDLSTLEPRALAKEVAYLSQFAHTPHISVLEALELGRRAYSGMMLKPKDRGKINESIVHFELLALLERNLESLSGGERQKVLIASALLQEPKVLLLDEPISHLDPKNQLEMLSAIHKATHEKGLITLVVLHDIQHAIHYTNTLLMLKQGALLHHGPTQNLSEAMLKVLFDVEARLHVSEGHTFVYYGHAHEEKEPHHHHGGVFHTHPHPH